MHPSVSFASFGRSALALVCLAALLVAAPAFADTAAANHISVPKGPGSIEGLGTADFSPSLSSGSASYSVAIAVPPGSAGFGPSLALSYDSGGGVTELGLGWRLTGVPKIRRRTTDGLPRFDETDTFELVGLGIPCELVEVSPGVFRPRFEDGSFVRVTRTSDGERWEARTKAGTTYRFGGDAHTEAEGDHVAAYLLATELDRHGHVISYDWDASEGHALLTGVRWNELNADSTNDVSLKYGARPDVHHLFASGIQETLTRRLDSVEVRHGGALVRRYDVAYSGGTLPSVASVTLVGRDGVSALPAARFFYSEAKLAVAGERTAAMEDAPGRSLASPDAALTDLDGDGLPDLLVAAAGHYRSYLNKNGTRWRAGTDWDGAASPSVSLGTTGVQLADVDADGAPDLLVKSGVKSLRYFPHLAGAAFGAPVTVRSVPSFSFEDPEVRLADMDGDRRADVVLTTSDGIAVGYNQGGTDWTEPAIVGRIDPKQELRFSDHHTELCDLNGDRVLDVCYLRSGALTYWLGRGRGAFEPAATASGVPEFDASAPYQLEDLNEDGWVDLVRVDVNAVSYALARGEGVFDAARTLDGTPPRTPTTSVRFADMNGSGTTDILWVDATGDDSAAWQYLELFPEGKAGLLRRIDNGLGKTQTIEYAPAAEDAAAARDAGTPWTTRLNTAMPVVRRVAVDSSLGDPLIVRAFSYRDGAYDPAERTFAGFGSAIARDEGDEFTPTLITETAFDLGLEHRVLRGAALSTETRDADGAVFGRSRSDYVVRAVASARDGRSIDYAFKSAERATHVEGRPASEARETLTEWEQDAFGNVVEERRWGEVSGSDFLVGRDESLVTRTFANDADEWLLGNVVTEELTDATGARIRFARKYYDGPDFLGLPLGEVTRGDVSREEAWVGPAEDAFELVGSSRYDADGLPLETRDARGGGHLYEWAEDHTSIRSERVKLEQGPGLVETAIVDGAIGETTSVTDYAGQTTRYTYDAFGRLETVVRPGDTPDSPTTHYSYQAAAPLSRIVTEARVRSGQDDLERSETLQDGFGRIRGTLTRDGDHWILAGVSLFDARGAERRTLLPRQVDAAGHDSPRLLDPMSSGTDSWRDASKRALRTRSPSGIEARTEYRPFEIRRWDGAQADASSPYEHTPTVDQQDGQGRLISRTQTLNGKLVASTYDYDAAGALVSRTDPEGVASRYGYDGRGQRVRVVDPDAGEHRFEFDATGNRTGHISPDGGHARFGFDLASRSVSEDRNGDGTPEVTRTWDDDGRHRALDRGKLVRVTGGSGESRHDYDARGRITRTTLLIQGSEYAVGSSFDDQDREVVHEYSDGSSIEIHRNPRGQIDGYGSALTLEYGEDGFERQRRFSTGVSAVSSYDEDKRRRSLLVAAPDGAVLESLKWEYDGAGNLTALKDARAAVSPHDDRSEAYTYDNLHRLTEATGTWGRTEWRYSASGSLISRDSSVQGESVALVRYGVRPHAPLAFDARALDYDARGRMTTDGRRAYEWNDVDELVRISSDTGTTENEYDGEGIRRVRVDRPSVGDATTTHFIDPWSEVKDGKLVRYIVHGGQRIVRLAPTTGAARATVTRFDGTSLNLAGLLFLGLLVGFVGAAWKRRGALKLPTAVPWLVPVAAGAAAALIAASPNPIATAMGLALCAALAVRLHSRLGRLGRRAFAFSVLTAGLLFGAAACAPSAPAPTPPLAGTIHELSTEDVLLTTDLLGSLLGETTASGKPTGHFAAYPFGVTRYDTSEETHKYAGAPRDPSSGLDAMGARFYASDLGVFTAPDPVAVTDPERYVGADFAAANPYAYAKDSPLIAADRDGHFWHIALGAAIGFLVGGAVEAGRQYLSTGKIESVGRVFAAATGAAVSGAITAAWPAAALGSAMGVGAGSGAAQGAAERLVASGGKSAGTVKDFAVDAAMGAVKAGLLKGGASLVTAVGKLAAAGPRYGSRLLPPPTANNPWAGPSVSTTSTWDRTMFRVWGGESKQTGAWLSPIKPASGEAARSSLALPPENAATMLSEVLVPAGTRFQVGTAAAAFGQEGGGAQVHLLEQIPNRLFGPGVKF